MAVGRRGCRNPPPGSTSSGMPSRLRASARSGGSKKCAGGPTGTTTARLAIAAPHHLHLLRAEHRDRVGAARVEQIRPAHRGAQRAPGRARVADDRLPGHDRALPDRLVVARPHQRHRQPPRRDPPRAQRQPLVRVHHVGVVGHQAGDLRHVEPVAARQLRGAAGQLRDALPAPSGSRAARTRRGTRCPAGSRGRRP